MQKMIPGKLKLKFFDAMYKTLTWKITWLNAVGNGNTS